MATHFGANHHAQPIVETVMRTSRKPWLPLGALPVAPFAILPWEGEIFRAAPPMPETVLAGDGSGIHPRADIETGRQAAPRREPALPGVTETAHV